jgi:hypothetical protein
MNPFCKLEGLRSLWAPLPVDTANRFYNDAKEGLQALWSQHYKDREIPGDLQLQLSAGRYRNMIDRRLRWAAASQSANSQINSSQTASSQSASQSQHSLRNRGRQQPQQYYRPETLPDELKLYLRQSTVDGELFDDDPIKWWRNVGNRRFPRLSFLASDLLSIPSSTAAIERQFNSTGSMVTPKRNRLSRVVICQAQSLRSWRRHVTASTHTSIYLIS